MKNLVSEADVKSVVKKWYEINHAWSFSPVSNGMGVHGIHDRLGAVPVVVTPAMVGKTVALFVSVESKRPGRRGESRRGMSQHQYDHMVDIKAAGGFSICCDGYEDLAELDRELLKLTTV